MSEDKSGSGSSSGSESSGTGDSSAGYHPGENQKPVTDTYRRNWDAIFGKKKRPKSRKK